MCYWKQHTFKDIHMQSHNCHGTEQINKTGDKQRYRPGVSEPRFKTLTLKAFWSSTEDEEDGEDEYEPSEPLSSLPIIPQSKVMYFFQQQHIKTDPFILSPQIQACDLTHPESLTLSLQAPIASLLPQKALMSHP